MKTETLWFVKPGLVELGPLELRDPGPDDVVVDVRLCGVCQFDVHLFAGREGAEYPLKTGHEAVGVVAGSGKNVTGLKPGDPVAVSGGGPHFSRRVVCHHSCAHRLPDGVTDFRPWLVEPVSCAVNGIHCTGIQPNDRVAVIGCGFMGLLLVQGLRHTMAREIVAADIDRGRLVLAKEFGADSVFDVSDPEQAKALLASKGELGYDIVFEAAGSQAALDLATPLLRMAGTLNIFGLHYGRPVFDGYTWHMQGLRVLNTSPMFNPKMRDVFAATPQLMERGVYDLRKLVTHVAPAEQAQQLFETAAQHRAGYIKGAVAFS